VRSGDPEAQQERTMKSEFDDDALKHTFGDTDDGRYMARNPLDDEDGEGVRELLATRPEFYDISRLSDAQVCQHVGELRSLGRLPLARSEKSRFELPVAATAATSAISTPPSVPAAPVASPKVTNGTLTVVVLNEAGKSVKDSEIAINGANQGKTDAKGSFVAGEKAPAEYRAQAAMRGIIFPEVKTKVVGASSNSTTLLIHYLPTLPKAEYRHERVHFELSAENYEIKIESDLKFVKGWGASVVKLGASVPPATGGLLDGALAWRGFRWMKKVGLTSKYWDGTAWQNLPGAFVLMDSNNFCVGFYKKDSKFVCQYGGEWPEQFTDWDITAPAKKSRITQWSNNIETTWTGKFDIKRQDCTVDKLCCRYKVTAKVAFIDEATFSAGMMIIADGNIRSNDSLWFIDEPRVAVAAHEFGHHLGNPDEYAGAAVNATLNSDGAVNGIDPDSIMGQNLTHVKKRHFSTVCKHFSAMVKNETGKQFTYEAVSK